MKGMGLDDVLIITDSLDENLQLSSRNLPNVDIVTVNHADPLSLMRHAKVLVTKSAIAKIEELFA
ncbi:50S ribosomal protein L4 [compost metagenome]